MYTKDARKNIGKKNNIVEDDLGLVTWKKLTPTAQFFAEQKRERISIRRAFFFLMIIWK